MTITLATHVAAAMGLIESSAHRFNARTTYPPAYQKFPYFIMPELFYIGAEAGAAKAKIFEVDYWRTYIMQRWVGIITLYVLLYQQLGIRALYYQQAILIPHAKATPIPVGRMDIFWR